MKIKTITQPQPYCISEELFRAKLQMINEAETIYRFTINITFFAIQGAVKLPKDAMRMLHRRLLEIKMK